MSTRTSIFKETSNGIYYGVYRHHDGYPEGAGQDLYDAIQEDNLDGHMADLYARYDLQYTDYTFNDIMEMWGSSDHEYGYIVHLDGHVDVYDIYFGPCLENNNINYLGELKVVLDNC